MKYKNISLVPYEFKLKSKLINSKNTYYYRSGFIIKLFINNYCGFGEASPLKYFSKENNKQVMSGFEELKNILVPNHQYNKNELIDLFNLYAKEIPSLNFALDIALYDMLSKKNCISLSKYLNSNALSDVNFSSIHTTEKCINNNTIKIKLFNNNVKKDIERFRKIAKKYNSDTKFRIDANGAYNINDAIDLCNILSSYNIEYIEEPLYNMDAEQVQNLKNNINIPIAIDETLYHGNYRDLVNKNLIQFVVLKASLFGSIKDIFMLNKYLSKNNFKIVLSSAI